MHDPRTEPKFGLYLMQGSDDLWHWCIGSQPPDEVFHVLVSEDGFSTVDDAWIAGLRRCEQADFGKSD